MFFSGFLEEISLTEVGYAPLKYFLRKYVPECSFLGLNQHRALTVEQELPCHAISNIPQLTKLQSSIITMKTHTSASKAEALRYKIYFVAELHKQSG